MKYVSIAPGGEGGLCLRYECVIGEKGSPGMRYCLTLENGRVAPTNWKSQTRNRRKVAIFHPKFTTKRSFEGVEQSVTNFFLREMQTCVTGVFWGGGREEGSRKIPLSASCISWMPKRYRVVAIATCIASCLSYWHRELIAFTIQNRHLLTDVKILQFHCSRSKFYFNIFIVLCY